MDVNTVMRIKNENTWSLLALRWKKVIRRGMKIVIRKWRDQEVDLIPLLIAHKGYPPVHPTLVQEVYSLFHVYKEII